MSALRSAFVFAVCMATAPVYSTVHAPSWRRPQVVSLDENFLGPGRSRWQAASGCAEAPCPRGSSSPKNPLEQGADYFSFSSGGTLATDFPSPC
jgi:hypothetical protein